MGDKKESLSFSFKKKQDSVQLGKSIVSEVVDPEVSEPDYVVSLEGKQVKSTKCPDKPTRKKLAIPLIKQNKWRNANDTDSFLDRQAAQEILQDTARYNQEWDDRGKEDQQRIIPLLLQNKIPDGFESEDRLNVALRPSDADYQQIPIDQFGLALLRGMGWIKDRGVGKNNKVTVPLKAHLRPKGLGLGADRSNSGPDKNVEVHNGVDDTGRQLELTRNAFCMVTSGTSKDLYGTVEGLDEDNSRVMVKLALNGKVVNIMQSSVRVVSKQEFDKYSKYLNKQKSDEYKAREMQQVADVKDEERSQSQKSKRGVNVDNDDSDVCASHDKRSKKVKKHTESKQNQHQLHHCKRGDMTDRHRKPDSDDGDIRHGRNKSWLRNDLRVRIVDKHLGGGKYYKEKAIIIDVPCEGTCVCQTEDGRVVENVTQLSLETVVPRQNGASVMLVAGTHTGRVARIMHRDKDRCIALVQLLADSDIVLKVQYDEICEYVANVNDHEEY